MFMVFALMIMSPIKNRSALATADCSPSCPDACVIPNHTATRNLIDQLHDQLRIHITNEFIYHQRWVVTDFFYFYILPAMMMMTEQLSGVGMLQMMAIGSFFDAKQQLEVQLTQQEKIAEAHRDYHSSVEMCYIGTAARSLHATERQGQYNAIIMSQRSQDRQLGNRNNNAALGPGEDREGRVEQYIRLFCDPDDNRGLLTALCGGGAPAVHVNKDVDYTRTVDQNKTLDVDFTNPAATNDEAAILAMQSYLFAHDTFSRPNRALWRTTEGQNNLMDLRSVVAKRNVAENSFNAIIGLKSRGDQFTGGSAAAGPGAFTSALVVAMGGPVGAAIPGGEAIAIAGMDQNGNPIPTSYLAQLEWMAKKIYLRPEFYTNLYDKPANVKRKNVAIQAADLMVDRETFRSDLRTEALLAVWLEMEVSKIQADVQNRVHMIDPTLKE
jgi:hypothetical protein